MTHAIQSTESEKAVRSAQGEDRSSFQPIRPWTANDFGFAKATEGLTWTDPTFEANWAALRQEGKFRGAYQFFHPELNADEQADFFLSFVQGHGGLEPGDMLVVDSEVMTGGASLVGEGTLAFLRKLGNLLGNDKDRHPLLVYTNLSVAAVLGDCTEFGLWIAYPSMTAPASVKPWQNWRFWQWGFGGGQGGGDRNAYNGTLAELTEWIDSFKNPLRQALTSTGDEATA